MRALKRQLSNVIYRHLVADAETTDIQAAAEQVREDSQLLELNIRSLPDPAQRYTRAPIPVAGQIPHALTTPTSEPILDTEGSLCAA